MQPYPNYKDSRLPWLGPVPEHWGLERLKYVVSNINDQRSTKNEQEIYIALEHIESGTGKLIVPDEEATFESNVKCFHKDDVLFSKLRPYLTKVVLAEQDGVCVGELLVLRGRGVLLPRFLQYCLLSKPVINIITGSAFGSKMPRADWNFVGNLRFQVPSHDEQAAIVAYLDRKTANIERFITKKRQLIALLNEQKAVIINRAVTKGLNPDVPTKTSGVEWPGDVPTHWQVRRLKYVSTIIAGQSPHESTYNDAGIGTILINGPVEYSEQTFGFTRALKWTTDPKKIVPKGTLLFCMRGSTTGRLNITHTEVSIGRGVSGIIANASPDYLRYVVIALSSQIHQTFKGSTFPSISSDELGNYVIASPPTLDEKEQVISYIKTETQKVDDAIIRVEREIELINEYRTTLISEAVTGKIDLRLEAENLTR